MTSDSSSEFLSKRGEGLKMLIISHREFVLELGFPDCGAGLNQMCIFFLSFIVSSLIFFFPFFERNYFICLGFVF